MVSVVEVLIGGHAGNCGSPRVTSGIHHDDVRNMLRSPANYLIETGRGLVSVTATLRAGDRPGW
jgi:hypothetical protein